MNKLMIMLVCAIALVGCGKKDTLDYTCVTKVSDEITITTKGHIEDGILTTHMYSSNGMEASVDTLILNEVDRGDGATMYINNKGALILQVGGLVSIGSENDTSGLWLECSVD